MSQEAGTRRRATTLTRILLGATLALGVAAPALAADPSPIPAAANALRAQWTAPTHQLAFEATAVEGAGTIFDAWSAGAETGLRYGTISLTGAAELAGVPVTVTLVGAFFYTNGTGPFTGSVTLTSAEGDLIAFRYDAFVALAEDGTTIGGVLTGLGGAGRWADVTGYGHVTGSRSGLVGSQVQYAFDLWLAGMPPAA
jgi:hypothetical protein